ncbi:Asp-tRNAAsn/Glu-tRNAGln amidotransferase A subunit [Catalinimonas alkaloidigena]|uniref:Asp-tRNAAsn/Glu-tRNAGln amidotransferase A subunit n=1 Tax=Catalinimonas alkaloidigena TaxID=1075417 RepID=A0A1G9R773_9BACT|nr:amidase family protein [Catalinimonas alkaloidigena]SDM18285.1 Asp-tRNAAsn/Glu-tRNAGln amidotransferase A subunit [Catalinimonas alkaloidigena]
MGKRFLLFYSLLSLLLLRCHPTPEQTAAPLDLTELTVADIHEAYRAGRFTAQQLVAAYLDRIKEVDTLTHAISVVNPEALAAAQALDDEFARTQQLRPLHGIPVIVKDNINTRGLPTTGGALALQDFVPDADAFIIQRLVDAGAIVLAKSNMAEWAFSPMHTESSTVGTTHNPYHLDHVPAGSSGGTAAAVAANFGTLGLGTDTGNSIRGPSSHNALVGFRTTLGLVSRSAIIPLYLRNDVVGPMCRTVEDATRVLEVTAGFDPDDPLTRQAEGKIPDNYQQFLQADGLQGARIGVLRALSDHDPNPEIKALFEQALADLRAQGADVVDSVAVPDFAALRQHQWCAEFRKDVEAYLATYVHRDTMQTLEDIIRVGTTSDYAAEGLAYQADHIGRGGLPEVPCGDAYTDPRRIAFREAIEHTMDSLRLDALVYPSWLHPPALIDSFQVQYRGDNSQIIAPHTGQPAFTVPMGFTRENLPAGLQFLGRMYAEPTLIKLTYAYEQATHHRVPPTLEK